jgi:hypothetical protein
MRLKLPTVILWLLSIVGIFLLIKSNGEILLPKFKDTSLAYFFQPFPIGNAIIFDFAMGYLVSIIFYIIVVWYPENRKKSIIKHNLRETYRSFKEDTIYILINACSMGGGGFDSYLIKDLVDQNEFRKYFSEYFTEDQNRWHAVFNGLDEDLLDDLRVELEILLNEATFVLNNVFIADENVFSFFKRLSQSVIKMKSSKMEYMDLKSLTSFLYEIFAGWSMASGYREEDIVKVMIDKI